VTVRGAQGRRLVCALLGAAVVPLLLGGGAAAQPVGGWLVYGNDLPRTSATSSSLPPRSLRPAWFTPVSGRISSQALVAQNVPSPGLRTVYVATTKGAVYALAENGYVRWRVELGQLERICAQIDGFGVTGTPGIDPDRNALYVADAFGRLHALDLTTGQEHEGWPVRLYSDFRRELVWGALTIVNGSVYVGTGSYCDRPMVGKVIRVELATRRVSRWHAVPGSLGGGGGVWGWGGIAFSARRGSLFVATGNAFRGGSNVGRRFREWAGYGEQLVELTPDLSVRAANHPRGIRAPNDLDFVGSPVVFRHRFCGELVAALNKNGFLYVWRSARVKSGPLFSLRLSQASVDFPLLTQPTYSARTRALYVSTPRHLVRVGVDRRCRGRVAWARKVGSGLFNSSPTIAGGTVWLAENSDQGSALLAFDVRTGKPRFRSPLAGPTYVAPTVVGERLYVGMYTGGIQGFALASALGRPAGTSQSVVSEHRSFADALHGWASREDGVYSTDDGGATWARVYPHSAAKLARTSAEAGILATGDRVSRCGCRMVRLWTADRGATWHRTGGAAGGGLVASLGTLWWWRGGRLYRAAAWPPRSGRLAGRQVAHLPGLIVEADAVPDGVLALVSNRVAGLGFDNSPRLLLVQGTRVSVLRLPRVGGDVLARSLEAAWPSATVRGFDVTAFTHGEEGPVTWSTLDGGRTWSVTRK
jgi:PQQ-like domain